jgi:hypothetical protein
MSPRRAKFSTRQRCLIPANPLAKINLGLLNIKRLEIRFFEKIGFLLFSNVNQIQQIKSTEFQIAHKTHTPH